VILNGLTHIHESANGSVITGKIKVQNNSKTETKIIVYNEDLMISCSKPLDYTKINSHERSLGNFIKTNIEEKTLQSNEVYDIVYTITIPTELKGSYWSIIMIEGVAPIKEEVENGIKIDSKVRYAVQVIANAGNVESTKIEFEKMQLGVKDSTTQTINVKLKNIGIFVAKTKLSIEIYDSAGKKLKTIEAVAKRIYPETCADFQILIKDLPKGKYESVLIADNGKDLYGANISLAI
jgi:hypothetical protein